MQGGGGVWGDRRGVGLRQINTCAAKYLYWSIIKKSLHLAFGVFIHICYLLLCITFSVAFVGFAGGQTGNRTADRGVL